ncbi:hypothetical protein ACJX0J_020572, partial [Zea mays]
MNFLFKLGQISNLNINKYLPFIYNTYRQIFTILGINNSHFTIAILDRITAMSKNTNLFDNFATDQALHNVPTTLFIYSIILFGAKVAGFHCIEF